MVDISHPKACQHGSSFCIMPLTQVLNRPCLDVRERLVDVHGRAHLCFMVVQRDFLSELHQDQKILEAQDASQILDADHGFNVQVTLACTDDVEHGSDQREVQV